MKVYPIHSFPLTQKDMQPIQQQLQKQVQICPFHEPVQYVAGADLAYGENKTEEKSLVQFYVHKQVYVLYMSPLAIASIYLLRLTSPCIL